MSGICTVDIIAESHSIISPLSMLGVGVTAGTDWTSARKIQENNHACAHTQRNLETSHKITLRKMYINSLSPPYHPPTPVITLPVSLARGHIYCTHPHVSPEGLPFQAAPVGPRSPVKG